MAVLGGVSPSGIQENCFIGKPPVTVSCAADAPYLVFLTETVAQRKMQTGVDKRGGLTRAWWTDDDVPGELVEVLMTVLEACFGFFQYTKRILEAFSELREFLLRLQGCSAWRGPSRIRHVLCHLLVGTPGFEVRSKKIEPPEC